MSICDICNKSFKSQSSMFVHKREKHTFYNTITITCPSCVTPFNSPVFNVKKNKYYDRCEECRDLANLLSTNPLKHNTYVYGLNKERYFVEKGKIIRVCSVYNCFNKLLFDEVGIKAAQLEIVTALKSIDVKFG
jgi:hypothetical protein